MHLWSKAISSSADCGRLPKYEKPKVERIENLSPSVIVDQSRLAGNARSTVGTISDMYAALRLLYSRIGEPYVGTASCFSFNDPNGMCPECSGIGRVMTVDVEGRIDPEKTWNEGMADLPAFHPGNWYWKQYAASGLFPLDRKWKDFSEQERNRVLYGADTRDGKRLDKRVDGISHYLHRILINRDTSAMKEAFVRRFMGLVSEAPCPACRGRRDRLYRHAAGNGRERKDDHGRLSPQIPVNAENPAPARHLACRSGKSLFCFFIA